MLRKKKKKWKRPGLFILKRSLPQEFALLSCKTGMGEPGPDAVHNAACGLDAEFPGPYCYQPCSNPLES
jgi:hypothetical protein